MKLDRKGGDELQRTLKAKAYTLGINYVLDILKPYRSVWWLEMDHATDKEGPKRKVMIGLFN